MSDIKQFSVVGPEALIPVAFSFARFLGPAVGIASVKSMSISVHRGTDPDAATRLYAAAAIDGQRVVQWVRYPALGVVYKIQCVIVADDGREWPCTGLLPVREI